MLRLIQCGLEFCPKDEYQKVGRDFRGIYVLYEEKGDDYDVVYIGMTDSCIFKRLRRHYLSKRKAGWTHFSAYAVWPNITKAEIQELEGLFRHLYRHDSRVTFNRQRRYKALQNVCTRELSKWKEWGALINNMKLKVRK
jgi:hypothetical protein